MRRAWAFAFSTIAVAAVVACTTDYQKGLDDPAYGGPNALSNQQPPGSTSDQPTGTSSGGATSDPACVSKSAGKVVAQTTPCAVTFDQVLAIFKAKTCTSAAGCHGTGNPPPLISDDAKATYNALANFTPSTGKIYVNPCSQDPTMSAISSNLDPNAAAGDRGTVMPPGVGLAGGDLTTIKTWVACGAPGPT